MALRDDQRALAREARAHLERCAERLGAPIPRTGEAIDHLGEAARTNRSARIEWLAAEELWWRMALSERRIAIGEAKKQRNKAPIKDLIQEALIGLLRAAKRFDPERGISFRTFAKWWARAQITRAINLTERPLHLSEHAIGVAEDARKVAVRLEQAGKTPTLERLKAELEGTKGLGLLDSALAAMEPMVSLDAPPPGFEVPLHELLGAEDDAQERLETEQEAAQLLQAIRRLPERERAVMELSLEELTKEQAAARLGLHRESVRKIRTQAHKMLRAALGELA